MQQTIDRDTHIIKPIAHKLRLNFTAFGEEISRSPHAIGTLDIQIDAYGALEPAPVSPSSSKPYQLLAGSVKAAYAKHRAGQELTPEPIIVSPGVMSGNTGTVTI